jgi:RNA polymerase sigma-70 factor (ECF subfamily)
MGIPAPPASPTAPTWAPRRELAFEHAPCENPPELSAKANTPKGSTLTASTRAASTPEANTPTTSTPKTNTPTTSTRTDRHKTLQDGDLARRALAGDGDAFAELYDRHERRVYGFCMRMLGTPHDAADATQDTFVRMLQRLPALQGRELNFAAYALACARNACYDTIEGRRRVEPVAEHSSAREPAPGYVGEDPERNALLAAAREEVRAANAQLPARQREVLALREVELLSYDEIGEIVGLNRNAVAQLISRARIKLRDLLQGSALAAVSPSSADCERALPLLARMQDKQDGEVGELDWVHAHLAACETCRLSQAAMQEAGMSYRALAPIVPLVWLRQASIARAAEFVGADWSDVASGRHAADGQAGGQHGGSQQGSPEEGQWDGRSQDSAEEGPPADAQDRADEDTQAGRGRTRWMLAGGALLVLCLLLFAIVDNTRDGHLQPHPATVSLPIEHASSTTAPSRKLRGKAAKTAGGEQAATVAPAATPSFPDPSGASSIPGTATLTPRPSSRRVGASHHRHKIATHSPTHAPPAPTITPQTTTTATPPPPPPATTTTPATQTTPAPTPAPTGETTGTTTTTESPPGGPGTFAP